MCKKSPGTMYYYFSDKKLFLERKRESDRECESERVGREIERWRECERE